MISLMLSILHLLLISNCQPPHPPGKEQTWAFFKSTNEIMQGTCLAVDGFFQRTNKPSKKEAPNQLSYYSGHYESYGVNCQAAVFSDLRFAYFGVLSPGLTNDNISYPLASGLKQVIDNLPQGYYAVADAAYTLTEHMLVPFTGVDRLDADLDAFNNYLSQVRIRVKMAFGRLVNKFRILNGKIGGSIDQASAILTACARLHNFIISQDGPFDSSTLSTEEEMESYDIQSNPVAPFGMSYTPVITDNEFESCPGILFTREAIVDLIREYTLRHPQHNIIRKQEEDVFLASTNGLSIDREYISPL